MVQMIAKEEGKAEVQESAIRNALAKGKLTPKEIAEMLEGVLSVKQNLS